MSLRGRRGTGDDRQIESSLRLHGDRVRGINVQYTVTHDPRAQVITATAEGEWSVDGEVALLTEILETVRATRARKLLGDVRKLKNVDLSTLRLYERVRSLQSRRREFHTPTARVAIVYNASDTVNLEQCRFFETTARNRGLP